MASLFITYIMLFSRLNKQDHEQRQRTLQVVLGVVSDAIDHKFAAPLVKVGNADKSSAKREAFQRNPFNWQSAK